MTTGCVLIYTLLLACLLACLLSLSISVEQVVDAGLLKEGEIDSFEMRNLAALPEADALAVVELFRDGTKEKRIGNKSGFLAGILRR